MTTWRKTGATPGKLLVAAVLAVVLIVVVVVQSGDDDDPAIQPRAVRKAARPVANKPVAAPSSAEAAETAVAETRVWPEFSRELVAQHDPFRLPQPLQSARTLSAADAADGSSRQAGVLDELRREGVAFVVLSDSERVAMIGDRQVKVGDVLEGFRVAEINSDGIVLVEIEH